MKTYSSPKKQQLEDCRKDLNEFQFLKSSSHNKEIFSTPTKSKMNNTTSSIKIPSKKLKQTFFDAKTLIKHCKECGMHWDPSFDTKRHSSFHSSFNRCFKSSSYLKEFSDKKTFSNGDILLFFPSLSNLKKKNLKINLETLIDRINYTLMGACEIRGLQEECKIIIYLKGDDVVGLLIFRIGNVENFTLTPQTQKEEYFFVGIERIHVHPLYRRMGIGRRMANYLTTVGGTIALSPTTSEGELFGKSLFGLNFPIYTWKK